MLGMLDNKGSSEVADVYQKFQAYPEERDIVVVNTNESDVLARNWGRNFKWCFRNGEPIFTLGPHCN